MLLSSIILLILGCEEKTEDPRNIYNEGLVALNEGRYDDATESLFDARDQARSDAELRQYASYNLALSYAKKGISAEAEDPQAASTEYEQAVTWFRDALQLNPEDLEARTNLEVVLKRIQLLADRLNAGENGLESRLDRLLDDTRTLRDQARALNVQLDAGTTPDAQRANFERLAVEVRSLQAQASTAIQLSSNELSNLEGKAEEERSDEDSMRMAQLKALSYHLEQGRDQIADARRVLRRTDIEKSLDRLDKAVRTIHRAREQLLEPLVVLQAIAKEESQLSEQTGVLAAQKNPGLFLSTDQQPSKLPSWFDAQLLSSEQGNIHERSDEILQRFSFAVSQDDQQVDSSDPEAAEFLALVQDAVPPLASAVVFMKSAQDALLDEDLKGALKQEWKAQQELSKAIERFADAKNLIELAYQTQQGLVMLVTPPQEGAELPVELSPEQRLEAVSKSLGENISRLKRLEGALRREKSKQLEQLPPQEEGSEEDPAENINALFGKAEELRSSVLNSLESMKSAISEESPVLGHATTAQEDLQDLRILFFSVVEHLKQLLEEQGTLRDATSTLISDEYEIMLDGLGLTLTEQQEHLQRAKAIAEVLQQQADVAAQSEEGQQQAEAFAEAYAHTSTAETAMGDAIDLLTQVQQEEGGVSHDPQPALEYQQEAMEALMAAIQALQPPQENQEEGEDQQEEQQEQMSKQQAERRLEAAKEREAERSKKRQEASGSVPVEKDW